MSNSALPNLPGFGAIAESMELVRKMWGGAGAAGIGIPGMTTPTLSVEDINKQIADLKAVEAWLTLNMNMLRGTIQALEVQSATLSALKSMGEAFKQAGKAATDQPAGGFSFPFSYPMASQTSADVTPKETNAPSLASSDTASSFADPAAWWNMLQSQFKQAVNVATTAATTAATTTSTTPGHDADHANGDSGEPATATSPANHRDKIVPEAAHTGEVNETNEASKKKVEQQQVQSDAAAPDKAAMSAKRPLKPEAKPPTP